MGIVRCPPLSILHPALLEDSGGYQRVGERLHNPLARPAISGVSSIGGAPLDSYDCEG